jgi:hypothetical protein
LGSLMTSSDSESHSIFSMNYVLLYKYLPGLVLPLMSIFSLSLYECSLNFIGMMISEVYLNLADLYDDDQLNNFPFRYVLILKMLDNRYEHSIVSLASEMNSDLEFLEMAHTSSHV